MKPGLRLALAGALIVAGVAVRWLAVGLPLDARTLNSWREADYAQIAREVSRGEAGFFHPRVDWRADTPGYVEMELPLLPWAGGMLWGTLGGDERWLRVLSALAASLAFLLFAILARASLPPSGAWVATAAMAFNPIAVSMGMGLQPESLLLCACVAAVLALYRFDRTERQADLLAAAGLLGLAVGVKATAVHLAPLFVFVVLRRWGIAALRRPSVYGAFFLATLPPAAWWLWAHSLFSETGLSLGVSNESHWLTLEMLRQPSAWLGTFAYVELELVFRWAGLLLLVAALFARGAAANMAIVWLMGAFAFMLINGNTTGDDWAWYYHLIAVPPACLLMGFGAEKLGSFGRPARIFAFVLVGVLLAGQGSANRRLWFERMDPSRFAEEVACARTLANHVPGDGRILLQGGPDRDRWGEPLAYHRSMTFWWMDRKGFVYPHGGLDESTLREHVERGAGFWWVSEKELDAYTWLPASQLGVHEEGRCGRWRLLSLEPSGPSL